MAAPHLDEYFRVQTELVGEAAELMGDPLGYIMMLGNPTKLEEFRQAQAKKVEQLREITGKSFDHHDINSNSVLEVGESQVLFAHFVERLVQFWTNIACNDIMKAVAKKTEMIKTMIGDDPAKLKEVEDKLAEELEKARQNIIATFAERREAYTSDKAAKDAAAFAVLDKDGDGKLTKEMVVEGLTPKTDTHYLFMVALGMSTKEEVEEEKKAEAQRDLCAAGAQAG
eukprot:CAMPEP_0179112406 /NCGR_PEP_ID=MMETSP0796-20121207/52542_1 /TAXON_ID=73915 /ORGANISM="Pyrodinium bahamense, Strain pbaha01" /LENGTH=226 /DNA_ID=CAMNT_0020810573 /DNA_START=16 /DNA_END=693 /DNA_ORIENTATION=-